MFCAVYVPALDVDKFDLGLAARRSVEKYLNIFLIKARIERVFSFKMGKKDKKKKKGFGVEKTSAKTDKKLLAKQKKMLQKLGEVESYSKRKQNKYLKLYF